MTEQSAIVQKNLEAIKSICQGLKDPTNLGQHLSSAILSLLDQDEKLDSTGAFAQDIADGRAAVAAQDPDAGIAAAESAEAKLV
jgi:hypothetical protein